MNKNKILFMSFGGKQYSDSPLYLDKYIRKAYPDKIIQWALYDTANVYTRNICTVNPNSFKFIYSVCTAGTIISNDTIRSYLPIRKNQIFLNTWHGGGSGKTIGFKDPKPYDYNKYHFKIQDQKTTAILSGSKFCTQMVMKESLGYNHTEILETGLPRNDLFFSKHDEIIKKVYHYFNLKPEDGKGIVLYAPTFRGNAANGSFLSGEKMFPIQKVLDCLNKKFHKNFVLLFRAHHAMNTKQIEGSLSASEYPDMQELLYTSDILITDYSSCMHDFSLMKKPVFLYIPDFKEYFEERSFYWDIEDMPFPYGKTVDHFIENITGFDKKKYENNVNRYLDLLGNFENGTSTKNVINWLELKWNEQKLKRI